MCEPIQNVGIYFGTNGFHEVASQAIACAAVHVQKAEARVQADCGESKAGFRLQDSVQIIQNRIRRIDGAPRRTGNGRNASSESSPMFGNTA